MGTARTVSNVGKEIAADLAIRADATTLPNPGTRDGGRAAVADCRACPSWWSAVAR